jgi:hypothetical protein
LNQVAKPVDGVLFLPKYCHSGRWILLSPTQNEGKKKDLPVLVKKSISYLLYALVLLVQLAVAFAVIVTPAQAQSPVGYWTFNEHGSSATEAADSSGYGHTATLVNGISWVTGQNDWLAAQWPTSNLTQQVTLAGTRLTVVLGTNQATDDFTPLSYMGITQSPRWRNFTISATPSSLSVAQGNQGTSTITTTISNGFNSAITLSASGMPSGATVSLQSQPDSGAGVGQLHHDHHGGIQHPNRNLSHHGDRQRWRHPAEHHRHPDCHRTAYLYYFCLAIFT